MNKGLVCLAILSVFLSRAQTSEQESFYKAELTKTVKTPNSPEAEAFSKYGDVNVSLYSGTPQIAVPLHTFNGREYGLPLSLTYDASGIKVEQLATWVGLGWNLNIGGRISRVVNGLPDDFIQGNYVSINDPTVVNKINTYKNNSIEFPSSDAAEAYFEFLYELSKNFIDAEPDYFSLNLPGINETIIFDTNDGNKPKVLDNPRIKVEKQLDYSVGGYHKIGGWIITGEDGTKYYFQVSETTKKYGSDSSSNGAIINEYASSWVLTKIVSSNNKDIFSFNYTSPGYWDQEQLGSSTSRVVNEFLDNQFYYAESPPQYSIATGYWVKQQFLSSLYHNGKKVMDVTLGMRKDLDLTEKNARLRLLNFYDTNGILLKSVEFKNDSYFGNPNYNDRYFKRLKLDGLVIKGKVGSEPQNYVFEYESPSEVPSRESRSQDYYGLFNGAANSVMYPKYTSGSYTFAGANREPNHSFAITGILKKIQYPTKGYTEFNYESHDKYMSTSTTAPEYFLNTSISGSYNSEPALYYDSNGNPCDDKYLDYNPPKIKFTTFTIADSGYYTTEFMGSNSSSEVYIAYLGQVNPEDCQTFNDQTICSNLNDPYQNYCDFYNANNGIVWFSNFSKSQNLSLEAGIYKAMIVLDEDSNQIYGQATAKVFKNTTNTTFGNYSIGGIRVKSIKDFTEEGALALHKFYVYKKDDDKSTGHVNFTPLLSTVKTFITSEGYKSNLVRTSTSPKGDDPYVVYSSVKEILKNNLDGSQGESVYEFFRESKGTVPRSTPPFENSYKSSLKGGEVKQTIHKDFNGHPVSQDDFLYFEAGSFTVNGFVTYTDENNFNKTIFLKENYPASGPMYVTYEYLDNHTCNASGGSSTGTTFCIPPDYLLNYQNYGYSRKLGERYSSLSGRYSIARGSYGGVSSQKNTTFLKDKNNNPLQKVTLNETTYEGNIGYLPRKVKVTTSEGDILETVSTYPKDNVVVGSSDLVAKNNLSAVLKSVTAKNPGLSNSKIISDKEIVYSLIATNVVLPTSIKLRKGNEALDSRIFYTYYLNGNIKESWEKDGPVTTYIWGYYDQYLIAKIENFSHSSIPSTSINNIVAASNVDNDNCTNTGCKEQILRNSVQDLRNLTALANAMVSSYTYDPLIGITSMTDPSGNTSFYVYDLNNRLKYIKNKNGEILEKYNYQYAYDEIIASTNSSASSVTSGQTVNFSTTASGGSGNFSYKWTVSNANLNQVTTTTTGSFSVTTTTSHSPSFTLTCEITDTVTNEKVTTTRQVNVSSSSSPLSVSAIAISPTGNTNKYVGQSVTYSVAVSGGSGNYRYNWSKTNSQSTFLLMSTTNTVSSTVSSEDCSFFTIKCLVTDTTTNETKEVLIGISISSGCSGGGIIQQ